MGTTRIKVIDLSGEQKEIKTSRKHAEKLTGAAKLKAAGPVGPSPNQRFSGTGGLAQREEKKTKEKKASTESTEEKLTAQEGSTETTSMPSEPLRARAPSGPEASAPSVIKKQSVSTVVARKPRRHHLGQKYLAAAALIEKNKLYPAREAIDLLYKTSITHFDPTVEVHFNVTDKNIRGSLNLPHDVGTIKGKQYLIFSDKKLITENTEKGQKALKMKPSVPSVIAKNVIWGNEQTISDIESGKLKPNRDFDAVIAQAKFMPALARIAKILGPAGLMPNPKNQTITENIASALESVPSATFEYKTDPSTPIVHTKLGKLSYKPEQLSDNLKALITSIGQTRIKKAVVATTMSPGIKVDISSIQ